MLIHPQFDPVAVSLGPLSIHWYGLLFLGAFVQAMLIGRIRLRQKHFVNSGFTKEKLDDVVFYALIGAVLGGRLGEVLLYNPAYYFSHPGKIFAVWEGGMSFHGGLIGSTLGMLVWGRRHGFSLAFLADFCAPLIPLGNAIGRMANFINAELYGRVTSPDLPWAMIFPNVDNQPRHPSQLYQAIVDGVLLFIVLWWFARKPRPAGAVTFFYLICYAIARSFTELYRNPDYTVEFLNIPITSGQLLSIPFFIVGVVGMWFSYRKAATPATATALTQAATATAATPTTTPKQRKKSKKR